MNRRIIEGMIAIATLAVLYGITRGYGPTFLRRHAAVLAIRDATPPLTLRFETPGVVSLKALHRREFHLWLAP